MHIKNQRLKRVCRPALVSSLVLHCLLGFLPETLQNFWHQFQNSARLLRFIPISIIYFRRMAFFHTTPHRAWPELALIRAAFLPSPLWRCAKRAGSTITLACTSAPDKQTTRD